MRNLRGNRTRHWPNQSRSARENINSLSRYYVKLTWWLAYRALVYVYIYALVVHFFFFFIEEIYVHASLLATRAVTGRYATLNTDDITLRNSSIMFNLSPTIRWQPVNRIYTVELEETSFDWVCIVLFFSGLIKNVNWWDYYDNLCVIRDGLEKGYQRISVNSR